MPSYNPGRLPVLILVFLLNFNFSQFRRPQILSFIFACSPVIASKIGTVPCGRLPFVCGVGGECPFLSLSHVMLRPRVFSLPVFIGMLIFCDFFSHAEGFLFVSFRSGGGGGGF